MILKFSLKIVCYDAIYPSIYDFINDLDSSLYYQSQNIAISMLNLRQSQLNEHKLSAERYWPKVT